MDKTGRSLRFGQLYEQTVVPNAKGAVKKYGPTIAFSGGDAIRNATLTLLENGLVEFVVETDTKTPSTALIPVSAFKVMVLT